MMRIVRWCISLLFCFSSLSQAIHIDGEGTYGLRGNTLYYPYASDSLGTLKAIEHNFHLLGEIRANENLSFFMGLRLFSPTRFLGDEAQAQHCKGDCRHQSVFDPGYSPYLPHIGEAYARYASQYFILYAGRKERHFGLGLMHSTGHGLWDRWGSTFDGIGLELNQGPWKPLKFSLGYDKLAETGFGVKSLNYGPYRDSDDINQFYLSIGYDDRQAGGDFSKEICLYSSWVRSGSVSDGGNGSKFSVLDLYAGLHFRDFSFRHEMFFTFGSSADPNLNLLGGYVDTEGSPEKNKVNSLALGGELEFKIAESGSYVGPEVFAQGDLSRHSIKAGYAYAPGDSDGYYEDDRVLDVGEEDARFQALNISKRSTEAKARALHENYQPGLLMFENYGDNGAEVMHTDGVFEPGRFMNAQVYSLAYEYFDLNIGKFEVKFLYGRLNADPPKGVVDYYTANKDRRRPLGIYSKHLGVEADLKYSRSIGQGVELGGAGAVLFPGDAWKVLDNKKVDMSYLLQLELGFRF